METGREGAPGQSGDVMLRSGVFMERTDKSRKKQDQPTIIPENGAYQCYLFSLPQLWSSFQVLSAQCHLLLDSPTSWSFISGILKYLLPLSTSYKLPIVKYTASSRAHTPAVRTTAAADALTAVLTPLSALGASQIWVVLSSVSF